VGGHRAAIEESLRAALRRTRFVIVTGGLGPTRDDVTKHAAAAVFQAPLDLDQAYLAALQRRFEEMGRSPMPPANRSQAEVPRGAIVLPNRWGTAPGLWLENDDGVAVLIPGVPREMRMLLRHEVLPRIEGRGNREQGRVVVASRVLRTTGVPESSIAAVVEPLEAGLDPLTVAYLPSALGVDLRLTAWNLPEPEAVRRLDAALAELRAALGTSCYGTDDGDLAAVVLDRLRAGRQTLAVAESCTGGLLGERITAVPGASAVFLGGVIAYANAVKIAALDVPAPLLAEHGAVSEPVVRAMSQGVQRRFSSDAALAITGIAGPDGGSPAKPVGTVWLAASLGDRTETVSRRMPGDREEIRARSAQAALDLLRLML
jgi:nicotinamide-nucleotide amidase